MKGSLAVRVRPRAKRQRVTSPPAALRRASCAVSLKKRTREAAGVSGKARALAAEAVKGEAEAAARRTEAAAKQ